MIGIVHDNGIKDEERRASVFEGNIHMQTGRPGCLALCRHADALIRDAFGDIDPLRAQYALAVPEFIQRVGPVKSRFTNDPRTKELMQAALLDLGVDPERTYFDLPRLRAVPSGDYLTSGVSYAYKAHRDTWYAHPRALVNFWMPVYGIDQRSAMAMFPAYFDAPVANHSDVFDYAEWVANARFQAASHVRQDTRPHPLPAQPIDTGSEIRIAGRQGDIMVFSGCHLHATAPNSSGTIRFSIDYRIVNQDDVWQGRGPANIDSLASGTTLPDFLRVADLMPFSIQGLDLSIAHPRALHERRTPQVA
jgi:hypothetical protein